MNGDVLRKPTSQVLLLGLASLVIYWIGFVQPYSLLTYWRRPHETIAKLTDYDRVAGAAYVLAILTLFLLYGLACRLVLKSNRTPMWGLVIAGAIAFNGVMAFLYPVDSSDVFDNILRGRMLALYGANPYTQRPSSEPSFRSDPFYSYAGWHDYPTAYGPWWEWIAAATARGSGDGVVVNVLAFKAVSVLAYAGTAALIGSVLREQARERALYGVILFAWNPLVIYSIAGNGHNDAVMVFLTALGIYFLVRRHGSLAAFAMTGGALVKFIPALLVPVVIVAVLQQIRGWPARTRYLVVTGCGCASLVAVSYAPYWHGLDVLGMDWRSVLFTTSLPTLVRTGLEPVLGATLADQAVSRGAALALAVFVLGQVYFIWRDGASGPFSLYVQACLSILIFYLLVTCLWFEPWYAVWPIGLAALVPVGLLPRAGVLLGLAALFKMPVFDFAMQVRPPDHVPPVAVREWQITPATLGLPWGYLFYHLIKQKVLARYETSFTRHRQTSIAGPDENAA